MQVKSEMWIPIPAQSVTVHCDEETAVVEVKQDFLGKNLAPHYLPHILLQTCTYLSECVCVSSAVLCHMFSCSLSMVFLPFKKKKHFIGILLVEKTKLLIFLDNFFIFLLS